MMRSLMKTATLGVSLCAMGMAMAGPTVYIPLGSADQVIAVDAASDRITARYSGVKNPHGLVATPDGEYLVAGSLAEQIPPAGAGREDPTSKLYLIHPVHGHVMLTIPVVGWTHHQAITPDGRYVLSTHATRGFVSVLDLQSNQIVHRVETGPAPNYTVVTKDGRRAFVSNSGNGTVAEIDLGSWEAVRTFPAGPSPEHMVLSADERMLYVSNPRAGTVSVVSLADGAVVDTYTVGSSVHGLDLGDDRRTLFASSKKEERLVAIDTMSGEQRTIPLAPAPYHLNTIGGTGKVYVSSRSKPLIWVVDQRTLQVTGTIDLPGGEGHQMAVVP